MAAPVSTVVCLLRIRSVSVGLTDTFDGTFDDTVGPWAGRPVKSTDREIIADLLERGLLVIAEEYTHSYPHCRRCGTPLLYWAKTAGVVRPAGRQAARGGLSRDHEPTCPSVGGGGGEPRQQEGTDREALGSVRCYLDE